MDKTTALKIFKGFLFFLSLGIFVIGVLSFSIPFFSNLLISHLLIYTIGGTSLLQVISFWGANRYDDTKNIFDNMYLYATPILGLLTLIFIGLAIGGALGFPAVFTGSVVALITKIALVTTGVAGFSPQIGTLVANYKAHKLNQLNQLNQLKANKLNQLIQSITNGDTAALTSEIFEALEANEKMQIQNEIVGYLENQLTQSLEPSKPFFNPLIHQWHKHLTHNQITALKASIEDKTFKHFLERAKENPLPQLKQEPFTVLSDEKQKDLESFYLLVQSVQNGDESKSFPTKDDPLVLTQDCFDKLNEQQKKIITDHIYNYLLNSSNSVPSFNSLSHPFFKFLPDRNSIDMERKKLVDNYNTRRNDSKQEDKPSLNPALSLIPEEEEEKGITRSGSCSFRQTGFTESKMTELRQNQSDEAFDYYNALILTIRDSKLKFGAIAELITNKIMDLNVVPQEIKADIETAITSYKSSKTSANVYISNNLNMPLLNLIKNKHVSGLFENETADINQHLSDLGITNTQQIQAYLSKRDNLFNALTDKQIGRLKISLNKAITIIMPEAVTTRITSADEKALAEQEEKRLEEIENNRITLILTSKVSKMMTWLIHNQTNNCNENTSGVLREYLSSLNENELNALSLDPQRWVPFLLEKIPHSNQCIQLRQCLTAASENLLPAEHKESKNNFFPSARDNLPSLCRVTIGGRNQR